VGYLDLRRGIQLSVQLPPKANKQQVLDAFKRIVIPGGISDEVPAYWRNILEGQNPEDEIEKIKQEHANNPKRKGISAPKISSAPEPRYTSEARLAALEGTVLVQTTIASDGTAKDIHILQPLGLGLEEEALSALGKWKFTPAKQNGQTIDVEAMIETSFRLR
jgi:TonB family protein